MALFRVGTYDDFRRTCERFLGGVRAVCFGYKPQEEKHFVVATNGPIIVEFKSTSPLPESFEQEFPQSLAIADGSKFEWVP